jgi:iron complex outermembrane recepter protein
MVCYRSIASDLVFVGPQAKLSVGSLCHSPARPNMIRAKERQVHIPHKDDQRSRKVSVMNRNATKFLLGSSLATLLTATALTAAHAQTAAAKDDAKVEEIVVTGSRIARPDLESASPVSVVTPEAFQQKGAVSIEQVLNELPQVVAGFSGASNNGSNGTASVDLRGIGTVRTLVLINGRRFVPSDRNGQVDLNDVPAPLLKRVDVLTGGGSAVYGSDAVAGVVNFILKDDFQGIEFGAQTGVSSQGDTQRYTFNATIGSNFADDRGNVVAFVGYTKHNELFQSQRDWSRFDINGGSSRGISGRLLNRVSNPFGDPRLTFPSDPEDPDAGTTYANATFNPDGSVRRFVNGFDLTNPSTDRYNFAPVNYLQRPANRFNIVTLGRYNVTENVEVFLEAYFKKSFNTGQLAPTPLTLNSGVLIPVTNPLLSPSARALFASRPRPNEPVAFERRMVEVGPRQERFDFTSFQINTGLRGKIFDDWKWDAFYSYGRVNASTDIRGDLSKSRLQAGLDGCPSVDRDGNPATPPTPVVPGCRVINVFGPGALSAADANYLRIESAVDQKLFSRTQVAASISGDVVELPAGPLGFAFGAEYRKDFVSSTPSEAKQRNDVVGYNFEAAISGDVQVKEAYAEMLIPVLKDAPLAESLSLEAGARYSDYNTAAGNVWTYKLGGEWKPVEDIRFRAMFQRAVRAPNALEIFRGGDESNPVVSDPCRSLNGAGLPRAVSASVAQVCVLSGLPDPRTVTYVQSNSQISQFLFGNKNLKAEKSNTWTIGAVIQPRFVSGLSVTVDYYNIKVSDYIAPFAGGAQNQVNACFSSGVTTLAAYSANKFCSNIRRSPLDGQINMDSPNENNSSLLTRGVDVAVSYKFNLGDTSSLAINAQGTYLMKYDVENDIAGKTEYAGLMSSDYSVLPKLRTNFRVTYATGPFDLSVNWQRFAGLRDDDAVDVGVDGPNIRLNYFDLSAAFNANENLRLYGGINNISDKKPPLSFNAISNAFVDTFDPYGRYYFVGATMKF